MKYDHEKALEQALEAIRQQFYPTLLELEQRAAEARKKLAPRLELRQEFNDYDEDAEKDRRIQEDWDECTEGRNL